MVFDLSSAPLSALTDESRDLISSRLNAVKVIPIVGPDRLPRHRDWRGIASLANITAEVVRSFNEHQDKTAKVLEIWQKAKDGSATVGRLLNYLQILDRYDVYEDLLSLDKNNRLTVRKNKLSDGQIDICIDGNDEDIITYDDKLFGKPQRYHAYVLYAKEDKEFVDELLIRTRSEGFKMCTEEDLVAGHATRFEPVARLISERCRYVVLIYSPDFMRSPAINYCMNLVQADGINKRQNRMIPVMYRQCALPSHVAHYHCLRYAPAHAAYDFWERLSHSLRIVHAPRLTSSPLPITEVLAPTVAASAPPPHQLLPPEPPRGDTASVGEPESLHAYSAASFEPKSLSLTNLSQLSYAQKKSKSGKLRKMMNSLLGKKEKKAIAVEN